MGYFLLRIRLTSIFLSCNSSRSREHKYNVCASVLYLISRQYKDSNFVCNVVRPFSITIKLRQLFTIIALTTFNSCVPKIEYLKIEKNYTDRDLLISNIVPSKEILYWKYIETSSNKVIREVGNKKLLAKYKIAEPNEGFFLECMPGYCYSYIIYIDNKGLHYVIDEKSLLNFIGIIDNISEAILVAKTQGLWIDLENEKGGAYKKTKTGYEMNLLNYEGCPETYESIFFKIDFNGHFKMRSKGIYKKTGNCIVS